MSDYLISSPDAEEPSVGWFGIRGDVIKSVMFPMRKLVSDVEGVYNPPSAIIGLQSETYGHQIVKDLNLRVEELLFEPSAPSATFGKIRYYSDERICSIVLVGNIRPSKDVVYTILNHFGMSDAQVVSISNNPMDLEEFVGQFTDLEFTHVDQFIDDRKSDSYASWFFFLFRQPARLKMKFEQHMPNLELYCTYESKRWRVTGCSSMGDVWLHSNFSRTQGYEKRVAVDECSEWSKEP